MFRYPTLLVLLFLAPAINSCSTTGPINNVGFKNISNIEDVVESFRNLGEGTVGKHSSKHSVYLSQFIWPEEGLFWHSDTDVVTLTKRSEKELLADAVTKSTIKMSRILEYGKDFKIQGGRITLNKSVGVTGSFREAAAGVTYESSELGIDGQGDGKYRQKSGIAGLFFIVFPLVGEDREDVRFVRLNKPTENELTTPSTRTE